MSSSSVTSLPQGPMSTPVASDPLVLLIKQRRPELNVSVPEYIETVVGATGYFPIELKNHSLNQSTVSIDIRGSDDIVEPINTQTSYSILPNEAVTLLAWFRCSGLGDSQLLVSYQIRELLEQVVEESSCHEFASVRLHVALPFKAHVEPIYEICEDSTTCNPKVSFEMLAPSVHIRNVHDQTVLYEYKGCLLIRELELMIKTNKLLIRAHVPPSVHLLKEFDVVFYIQNNAPHDISLSLDAISEAFCNVGCRPCQLQLGEGQLGKAVLTYLSISPGRHAIPIPTITFHMADALELDFIGGSIDVHP